MKRYILLLLLLNLFCRAYSQNDSIALVSTKWETQMLEQGVVWRQKHFRNNNYLESNQLINIVEISPASRHYRLGIAYTDSLLPVSVLAEQGKAMVAINGSYFTMKSKVNNETAASPLSNRSEVYLRVGGRLISYNKCVAGVGRHRSQTGTVLINGDRVYIRKADSLNCYWEDALPAQEVMTSGPMLLEFGQPVPYPKDDFCLNRHPRTAIGLKRDNTIILMTVDGRSAQANGMSIGEIQQTMKWLGCTDALNLDGGGSTTMVIKGQPHRGVVNYPTDNKCFDHSGERSVANALLLIKKETE